MTFAKLAGITLVKLGLLTLDPEVPKEDAHRIGREVDREAQEREWPEGWYEDPSVLEEWKLNARREE